jgi:hypothetical protein
LEEAKARESERIATQKDRESERMAAQNQAERARLLAALEWFSGKTQRRAIGLAIVEANWDAWKDLQPTWVAVLVKQAVYLLTTSKSAESRHERANLDRIVRLLKDAGSQLDPNQRLALGAAFAEALDSSPGPEDCRSTIGVHVDCATLREWDSAFSGKAESARVGQDMGKVRRESA